MLLQSSINLPLPFQMTKVVTIPFIHVTEIDKLILQINLYFQQTNFRIEQLFYTVIFIFLGYGVLAFLYAILYSIAGPPRYGPFDVPPSSVK